MFISENQTHLSVFNKIKSVFNKPKASKKSQKNYKSKLLTGEYEDLHDLNIAYVLKGFPTLSQTFVLNELKYLVENNYNVVVFAYMNPMDPVELDFDLEVVRFDKLNEGENDLTANLEKLLIDYEIDIMHTHFVYPPATDYTFPVGDRLGIPYTVFAHAVDIFKSDVDKINRVDEIAQSKYCKGILTLSNYHKNYLMERNVPEDKIVITRQATEYEIHELELKDRPVRKIVSISRFVEKKGIDVLIDAAKILEDEDFEFIIYGFGGLRKAYEKQIADLELENIHVGGLLDGPNEVKKVFDSSDLLVAPCRIAKNGDRDGIPTVIFEAMAYGVSVLTTSVSAIPEVINDGKNGFMVEADSPELLAKKIMEIADMSSQERFEIIKQAQDDVQGISSVENTMKALFATWGFD